MQELLPPEILALLPAIYANDGKPEEEVKVPLKLFNPTGAGTWYVTELDPETLEAFGYVTGLGENELGYISVEELKEVRLPMGLKIERDESWDPETTLAAVMKAEPRSY